MFEVIFKKNNESKTINVIANTVEEVISKCMSVGYVGSTYSYWEINNITSIKKIIPIDVETI